MSKKNIIIGIVVLIVIFGISAYFFGLHRNKPFLDDEIKYEQVAVKFISENDSAFIEDGYELKLVSKERIDNKNIKMVFSYKLYSYPEGDQFRVNVIVDTESGLTKFLD